MSYSSSTYSWGKGMICSLILCPPSSHFPSYPGYSIFHIHIPAYPGIWAGGRVIRWRGEDFNVSGVTIILSRLILAVRLFTPYLLLLKNFCPNKATSCMVTEAQGLPTGSTWPLETHSSLPAQSMLIYIAPPLLFSFLTLPLCMATAGLQPSEL